MDQATQIPQQGAGEKSYLQSSQALVGEEQFPQAAQQGNRRGMEDQAAQGRSSLPVGQKAQCLLFQQISQLRGRSLHPPCEGMQSAVPVTHCLHL